MYISVNNMFTVNTPTQSQLLSGRGNKGLNEGYVMRVCSAGRVYSLSTQQQKVTGIVMREKE